MHDLKLMSGSEATALEPKLKVSRARRDACRGEPCPCRGLRRPRRPPETFGVLDLPDLLLMHCLSWHNPAQCTAALLSPSTGILDSHALMARLLADFEAAGGILVLGTQVIKGILAY